MSAKIKNPLTKEKILAAPEKDYMNEDQLAFFRSLLLELHESTVARVKEVKEQIAAPHDTSDESDIASWQEQANIALRIIDREQKLLPKIQKSLEQIRHGDYGYCAESGEPIGIPRLLARPTAEYAADVKSLQEIKEDHYID